MCPVTKSDSDIDEIFWPEARSKNKLVKNTVKYFGWKKWFM
jgi:hypothetical protein